MYVAVKGGETAVKNSRKRVAEARRGNTEIPEITAEQIQNQLGLSVDRVMAEGALYDPGAASAAIKQAQGDLIEAIFLVRAFRTTLKRFGNSNPINTEKMQIIRRVSGIFKDIPGGQILGPTYDYTHRLIEFDESDSDILKDETDDCSDFEPTETSHVPRVLDLLKAQGLIEADIDVNYTENTEDLTRAPLKIPASRNIRLQNLARGDEGFLLGSAYSLQRGFGMDCHPFLGELKVGYVEVMYTPPELGFEIKIGQVKVTECFMVNRFNGSDKQLPGFENGYGLVFGHNERKAMSISLLDRSLQESDSGQQGPYPAQDQEFILSHSDNVESSGFVQHLKLPHYVDFQSELIFIRNLQDKHTNEKEIYIESSI